MNSINRLKINRAGAASTAALFSLIALSLLLSGCMRTNTDKRKKKATPSSPLEAAKAWPGTKLSFLSDKGEMLFKLRRNQGSGYKVFAADFHQVGYIRAVAADLVISPRDNNLPSYTISPDAEAEPPHRVFLVSRLDPIDPSKPLPPDSSPPVVGHITQTPAIGKDACPVWTFADDVKKSVTTITPVPSPEDETPNCRNPNMTWKVTSDGGSTWLSADLSKARTIKASSKPPQKDEALAEADEVLFQLKSRRMPTLAAAPASFPEVNLLLKAGYIAFLERTLTSPVVATEIRETSINKSSTP